MLDKYNVDNSHKTDCDGFDGNDDDGLDNDAPRAELKSSYHEVILKIYLYAPQILTSILPILTQELLVCCTLTSGKCFFDVYNTYILSCIFFLNRLIRWMHALRQFS